VKTAIGVGYRLIDTAAIYKNEDAVAAGIAASGVARESLFITTKLSSYDQGYDNAHAAFNQSLKNLQTDYVDLYLVHWPGTSRLPLESPQHAINRKESWKALEEIHSSGRARAIGVSNFTVKHLREMMEQYGNVKPAVNQIEMHPFLLQNDLLEYCASNKIVVTAYSPLGTGSSDLLKHRVVNDIAKQCGHTAAQVLIRWGLQHGAASIPKSVHEQRIVENLDVFGWELTDVQMEQLDGLNNGTRYCWDPTNVA
jgi:diketogulonate reductase-like aldo/keto reductase